MVKLDEEFYKNEGIVVYVKGRPMLMIHPDNLENNTKALTNGDMKLGWELMLSRVNGTEKFEEDWYKKDIEETVKAFVSAKKIKLGGYSNGF